MQYSQLIARIEADIYNNGAQLITGDILQGDLLAIISALASAGAGYGGIITPDSSAPASLDQATFYIAIQPGTYSSFGVTVTEPSIVSYGGGSTLTFTVSPLGLAPAPTVVKLNTGDNPYVLVPLTGTDGMAFTVDIEGGYSGGSTEVYAQRWLVNYSTDNGATIYVTGDKVSTGMIAWALVYESDGGYFLVLNVNTSDLDYVTIAFRDMTGDPVPGVASVASIADYTYSSDTVIIETESQNNKVTSIGAASSNIQYPSAKAVYDALSGKQATINTVNVSVSNTTGTPSGTASVSGSTMNLSFTGIKGEKGDTGATGPQGPQGNTGSSVDYPFEMANNLTTDDATMALSAAQGVVLDGKISQLEHKVSGSSIDYYEGIILNPQGGLLASADKCVSDYVPVTTNDIVTTHPGFASVDMSAFILGYDSSKNYVSGQYWAVAREQDLPERNVTIANSNVRYVRMVFSRDASEAFVKVNGEILWKYQKPIIGIIDYQIKQLGGQKKLYTKEQYAGWMSGFVRDSDGTQASSSVNSCTGFIDISEFDNIIITSSIVSGVTNAAICFYTSEGVFISSVLPNRGEGRSYETRILSVPANAKFVRASIYTQFIQFWELTGVIESDIKTSIPARQQKITMEFGNLDANGQMKPYASDFFEYARTPLYYKLQSVNLPYSYKIYVYGSDYALVDTITAQANTDYELDTNSWHKIVINYTENSIPVKEIVIDLDVIEKSYNIITPKTIKTFQYLVKYKKGRGLYEDGNSAYSEAYNMGSDLISNTIRVFLPSNYSPTGEPVKMIYKAHGSNGYSWIDLDTWGGDSSIDYLADEGFALYDMFAGTSYYSAIINPNLTHDSATRIANYNIPIQLAAQVAAYEWMVRHFNIDPRIYVFGKSHGGMAGIYATNMIVPTRAVALFAPLITQISDMYQPWGNHSNECSMCLDDMCFDVPEGMTFDQMVTTVNTKAEGWKDIMISNARKQTGLNAYLNGITNEKQSTLLSALMDDTYRVQGGMDDLIRHSETPVKVWCAPDDAEVVFANGWNFIKSLQNGGSNAQFREFPTGTGGHYFDSFTNSLSIKDTVTTALGVQYTAPRAYIEAVNFFHQF